MYIKYLLRRISSQSRRVNPNKNIVYKADQESLECIRKCARTKQIYIDIVYKTYRYSFCSTPLMMTTSMTKARAVKELTIENIPQQVLVGVRQYVIVISCIKRHILAILVVNAAILQGRFYFIFYFYLVSRTVFCVLRVTILQYCRQRAVLVNLSSQLLSNIGIHRQIVYYYGIWSMKQE